MQDLNQQPSLAPETVSQGKAKSAPKSKDQLAADFQTTIEQTLERMEQSKQETQEAPDEDILAQMLKAMTSGGTLPDAGGDDDFSQVLLNVMEQLTNKEILYEPMKEIHDGYPAWLTKHEATEKPEDLKRYLEQQRIVGEIVQRFERNEYSDESAADREYIVERMQQVWHSGLFVLLLRDGW